MILAMIVNPKHAGVLGKTMPYLPCSGGAKYPSFGIAIACGLVQSLPGGVAVLCSRELSFDIPGVAISPSSRMNGDNFAPGVSTPWAALFMRVSRCNEPIERFICGLGFGRGCARAGRYSTIWPARPLAGKIDRWQTRDSFERGYS